MPRPRSQLRSLAWHPDKRDRLRLVAGCVAGLESVLDVGGRGRELAGLLPGARVVSANVEAGSDVLVAPARLPFPDGEFAAVASSDVLEHVPPAARAGHVAELVRVARARVVLCCPLHTAAHALAEQRLAQTLERELGLRLGFLDEHLEHGLPCEEDVIAMFRVAAPGAVLRVGYQGDFVAGDALLLDGARARYRLDPLALARYVGGAYLRRPRAQLEPQASPRSGRIFLIADRAAPPSPRAAPVRSPQPSGPS